MLAHIIYHPVFALRTPSEELSCVKCRQTFARASQVLGAMLAGEQKAVWEEALCEMREAGHLEAGGPNLFVQLRIPYDRVPPLAQVKQTTG